jgi:hypothetical protein
LWRRGAALVRYDARRDLFAVEEGGREQLHAADGWRDRIAGSPAARDALDYWGDDISEAIS